VKFQFQNQEITSFKQEFFVSNLANKLLLANLPNRYSALCLRPVTHAQTWASYSALYRFGRLSLLLYRTTAA